MARLHTRTAVLLEVAVAGCVLALLWVLTDDSVELPNPGDIVGHLLQTSPPPQPLCTPTTQTLLPLTNLGTSCAFLRSTAGCCPSTTAPPAAFTACNSSCSDAANRIWCGVTCAPLGRFRPTGGGNIQLCLSAAQRLQTACMGCAAVPQDLLMTVPGADVVPGTSCYDPFAAPDFARPNLGFSSTNQPNVTLTPNAATITTSAGTTGFDVVALLRSGNAPTLYVRNPNGEVNVYTMTIAAAGAVQRATVRIPLTSFSPPGRYQIAALESVDATTDVDVYSNSDTAVPLPAALSERALILPVGMFPSFVLTVTGTETNVTTTVRVCGTASGGETGSGTLVPQFDNQAIEGVDFCGASGTLVGMSGGAVNVGTITLPATMAVQGVVVKVTRALVVTTAAVAIQLTGQGGMEVLSGGRWDIGASMVTMAGPATGSRGLVIEGMNTAVTMGSGALRVLAVAFRLVGGPIVTLGSGSLLDLVGGVSNCNASDVRPPDGGSPGMLRMEGGTHTWACRVLVPITLNAANRRTSTDRMQTLQIPATTLNCCNQCGTDLNVSVATTLSIQSCGAGCNCTTGTGGLRVAASATSLMVAGGGRLEFSGVGGPMFGILALSGSAIATTTSVIRVLLDPVALTSNRDITLLTFASATTTTTTTTARPKFQTNQGAFAGGCQPTLTALTATGTPLPTGVTVTPLCTATAFAIRVATGVTPTPAPVPPSPALVVPTNAPVGPATTSIPVTPATPPARFIPTPPPTSVDDDTELIIIALAVGIPLLLCYGVCLAVWVLLGHRRRMQEGSTPAQLRGPPVTEADPWMSEEILHGPVGPEETAKRVAEGSVLQSHAPTPQPTPAILPTFTLPAPFHLQQQIEMKPLLAPPSPPAFPSPPRSVPSPSRSIPVIVGPPVESIVLPPTATISSAAVPALLPPPPTTNPIVL